jgi:hypothetical protein
VAGIVRSAKITSRDAAHVIHQDVVILGGTGLVTGNSFEDFDQTENVDIEPGFLFHFPPERRLESFARFHSAARQ